MGEIFLAKVGEIQGFEKPIVIKKILPHLARDKEFLRRFIEEAQIAIKLTHGNIVPVYEVGKSDDEYFLALQYIEGRDLRAVISKCQAAGLRLPPELCLYLVREIANGLAYAHRKTDDAGRPLNLVHCDISPPNILVTYEGEVKIIDFGISQSAMQRSNANEEIGFGKFGYMAPEQLLRGGVVDRRTDIYSTGVLLYELLTGQRLFNFPPGVDYRQVAREVTAGDISPPSFRDLKLTERFDALVMKALKTATTERYQSAEELRDAVQQHLYAMNPTISADALATFIKDIFADELLADRQMLRSLSQTDVEPFRTKLHDATSHTVSFALAHLLEARPFVLPPKLTSSKSPTPHPASASEIISPFEPDILSSVPVSEPPPSLSPANELSGKKDNAAAGTEITGTKIKGPGTRKLSEKEQKEIMTLEEDALPVSELIRRQLPWYSGNNFLKMGAGVLVIGGAIASLLWYFYSQFATLPAKVIVPPIIPPILDSRIIKPDIISNAQIVGEADASQEQLPDGQSSISDADSVTAEKPSNDQVNNKIHIVLPPETIHKKSVTKLNTKTSGRNKKSRGALTPPSKGKELTAATMQKKFQLVRQEYQKFTRSYGQRLESEWQQILFTNTYGKMDENKYQHLNDMLDRLRKHMKQIRSKGNK